MWAINIIVLIVKKTDNWATIDFNHPEMVPVLTMPANIIKGDTATNNIIVVKVFNCNQNILTNAINSTISNIKSTTTLATIAPAKKGKRVPPDTNAVKPAAPIAAPNKGSSTKKTPSIYDNIDAAELFKALKMSIACPDSLTIELLSRIPDIKPISTKVKSTKKPAIA